MCSLCRPRSQSRRLARRNRVLSCGNWRPCTRWACRFVASRRCRIVGNSQRCAASRRRITPALCARLECRLSTRRGIRRGSYHRGAIARPWDLLLAHPLNHALVDLGAVVRIHCILINLIDLCCLIVPQQLFNTARFALSFDSQLGNYAEARDRSVSDHATETQWLLLACLRQLQSLLNGELS